MDKLLRLPPGFRFHPTDEELLEHYLRRKAFRCPLPASIIPDVDLSKYQPSDIPDGASAGFLEKEKYFFAREFASHRSAGCGYWKPTGKDRKIAVSCRDSVVGVKRVLAFYKGRPSHGSRTNWVMHEYRLADTPVLQMERWVLCRVFRKRRATRRAKSSWIGQNNKTMLDDSATRGREDSGSGSSCLTELVDESDSEEEACYADSVSNLAVNSLLLTSLFMSNSPMLLQGSFLFSILWPRFNQLLYSNLMMSMKAKLLIRWKGLILKVVIDMPAVCLCA